MTQEVLYCFEDSSRMGELKVRRLPVLNTNKRLIGLFSLGDILRAGDDDQTRVQDKIEQFHRGFVGRSPSFARTAAQTNRRLDQPANPKATNPSAGRPTGATTMTDGRS